MPCSIYLDSSVLCALADPPARSGHARLCQQLTRRWWRTLHTTRHLCTSEIALQAIRHGPANLASARLTRAEPLYILPVLPVFQQKAELLASGGGLKSLKVGTEIACAAYFGTELYVTWSWCAIDALRLPQLQRILAEAGLGNPQFITPLQLLETEYETLSTAQKRGVPRT